MTDHNIQEISQFKANKGIRNRNDKNYGLMDLIASARNQISNFKEGIRTIIDKDSEMGSNEK